MEQNIAKIDDLSFPDRHDYLAYFNYRAIGVYTIQTSESPSWDIRGKPPPEPTIPLSLQSEQSTTKSARKT
jgi:hypothetical protein